MTLADVQGQGTTPVVLQALITRGQIPAALVFAGVRGSGKTSTARIFGAALNCSSSEFRPCLQCPSCLAVRDGISSDVIEVDAASNNGVENIRKLRDMAAYAATAAFRIFLLDEAQSISPAGWNALLKLVEEPPAQTMFILLTTEPSKIPDTILSRCMKFEFRRIPSPVIVERLAKIAANEGFPAETDLIESIADRALGSMRDAVMSLNQAYLADVTTLDAFLEITGDYDSAPAILKAMYSGSMPLAAELVDKQLSRTGDATEVSSKLGECLRDLLVLIGGGTLHRQSASLAARVELAKMIPPDRVLAAMQLIWALKTQIRGVEDPRSMLDIVVALMTETLSRAIGTATPKRDATPAAIPRQVTLEQMRAALT
jgi:DNA polymerase-3 subunit gamma/tau